jgi:hypothetical protein
MLEGEIGFLDQHCACSARSASNAFLGMERMGEVESSRSREFTVVGHEGFHSFRSDRDAKLCSAESIRLLCERGTDGGDGEAATDGNKAVWVWGDKTGAINTPANR